MKRSTTTIEQIDSSTKLENVVCHEETTTNIRAEYTDISKILESIMESQSKIKIVEETGKKTEQLLKMFQIKVQKTETTPVEEEGLKVSLNQIQAVMEPLKSKSETVPTSEVSAEIVELGNSIEEGEKLLTGAIKAAYNLRGTERAIEITKVVDKSSTTDEVEVLLSAAKEYTATAAQHTAAAEKIIHSSWLSPNWVIAIAISVVTGYTVYKVSTLGSTPSPMSGNNHSAANTTTSIHSAQDESGESFIQKVGRGLGKFVRGFIYGIEGKGGK